MKMITVLLTIWLAGYSSMGLGATYPVDGADLGGEAIFDDEALINGYTDKYAGESKEVLLAMMGDESLGAYKSAAATRVFKQKYGPQILKAEKPTIIRMLIKRLSHSDSAFVQVEIMHTLVVLDRYQYFETMVPALILKMDHYNRVVSALAYDNLQEYLKTSTHKREARIVFNTLRKIFFLSRKRLPKLLTPDYKLQEKLDILRWSIKVLGNQMLKKLPKEVIVLL